MYNLKIVAVCPYFCMYAFMFKIAAQIFIQFHAHNYCGQGKYVVTHVCYACMNTSFSRHTLRQTHYLSINSFIDLSIHPSIRSSIYPSIHPSIYIYIHLYASIYIYIHLYTSIYIYIHLYAPVYTCIHLYTHVYTVHIYIHRYTIFFVWMNM